MNTPKISFYCEDCKAWTWAAPDTCDEPGAAFCDYCGSYYGCGECGQRIYMNGFCQSAGCPESHGYVADDEQPYPEWMERSEFESETDTPPDYEEVQTP